MPGVWHSREGTNQLIACMLENIYVPYQAESTHSSLLGPPDRQGHSQQLGGRRRAGLADVLSVGIVGNSGVLCERELCFGGPLFQLRDSRWRVSAV